MDMADCFHTNALISSTDWNAQLPSEMDPPIITKVWYPQPSDGVRHFSHDSGNLITTVHWFKHLGCQQCNGDHLL